METRDFTGLLSAHPRKNHTRRFDHDYRDLKKRPGGSEFNVLLKNYYGAELEKYANEFWTAALTYPGITKICVTVQINADKNGLLEDSGIIFKTFWSSIYKCTAGILTISPTLYHLEICLHDDMYYMNDKNVGGYTKCNWKILGRDDCMWDLFNSFLMSYVGCDWYGQSIVPVNMIVWMASKLVGIRTVIIPWIIIYGLRTVSLSKHCALSRTLRFIFPLAEKIDVGWSRYIPQNLVNAIIEEKYARGANPFIQ